VLDVALSQLGDDLQQQIIGQMGELFGGRHLQRGAQDPPGLARQTLAGLPNEFQSGIRDQGVRTAGTFERVVG
jgi:hypothetical protein